MNLHFHDNDNEKVLLDPKSFTIRATRPGAVTSIGDKDLWHCLKDSQDHDQEVTQALTTILQNGPRTISKGLEDWNFEEGLILHKGKIYTYPSPQIYNVTLSNFTMKT